MKKYVKELIKSKVFLLVIIAISILLLMKLFNIKDIPCLFHSITHKYCPGCGVTRMIISLFHLQIYQAFRYNILVFLLMPFILFYVTYSLILWIRRKENNLLSRIPNGIWNTLIVITILFGVLRNISYFSFLAPTVISK